MRFALFNDQKTEPRPKLRGRCPHCGDEVISKCGRIKVWHWAHKSREVCDPWWENETEWHRSWKNNFPQDWQEMSAVESETGEIHIADVKTPHDLVVEFQHSPMPYEEMMAREAFYKNMIWIVDGLRSDLDISYFRMGLGRSPIQTSPLAYAIEWWGRGRLLQNWALARSPVFLDFGDSFTQGPPVVWRLVFFDAKARRGAVAPHPKHLLVESISRGNEIGVPYFPKNEEGVSTSPLEIENRKNDAP